MNPAIRRYGIFSLAFLCGVFAGAGLSQFGNNRLAAASTERKIAANTGIISFSNLAGACDALAQ